MELRDARIKTLELRLETVKFSIKLLVEKGEFNSEWVDRMFELLDREETILRTLEVYRR